MTTIWIDAQLQATIAAWIDSTFEDISAFALRDLGLRDAEDWEIFTSDPASSEGARERASGCQGSRSHFYD